MISLNLKIIDVIKSFTGDLHMLGSLCFVKPTSQRVRLGQVRLVIPVTATIMLFNCFQIKFFIKSLYFQLLGRDILVVNIINLANVWQILFLFLRVLWIFHIVSFHMVLTNIIRRTVIKFISLGNTEYSRRRRRIPHNPTQVYRLLDVKG